MFQNYLKIAIRNLRKHKLHAGINILGLALGIAVVILIALFVQNEFQQDTWQAEEGKVYRVFRHWGDRDAGWVWSPPALVDAMEAQVPEVLNAAGLIAEEERLLDYKGKKIFAETSAQVDSTFFLTAPLPFLYGDAKTVLEKPENLVISESLSEKLFGKRNPIGEPVKMEGMDGYQIAGVLRGDIKTHLNYEVFSVISWQQNNWTSNQNATYVRLTEGANLAEVEAKIYEISAPELKREFAENGRILKDSELSKWGLQPIEKVHLYSQKFTWGSLAKGDIRYVMILILIGAIVLLVAVINYMNLATARVSLRAKEVGVRKVTGAEKQHLVSQFLIEAIFQSVIALILAMMLAEFLLPTFNGIVDRTLSFIEGGFSGLLLPLILLAISVGFLAGIYPAFVLSSFKPVKVLKGVFKNKKEGFSLRKTLVISQFSISIALIIVMSFIFKQVNYMLEQDLGFDAEQVLVVPLNLWESKYRVKSLENEILNAEGVETMAISSMLPGDQISHWTVNVEGHEEPVGTLLLNATHGFDETLGLEVVEGRFLDERKFGQDTLNSFVVNESFVKKHNLTNPIGKEMGFIFDQEPGRIVGLIKDFHQSGLQNEIKPLAIVGRNFLQNVSMRVSTQNLKTTINDLESIWSKIEPEHPMRFSFLDQDFANQYSEQERFGNALFYATLLTIFIAMLGLFGLASFAAERRTKEIGIRKILGARSESLVALLIKDFLILVILAGIIAIPIGYFLTQTWLEDFAYRTTITASPFFIAMLAALGLTVLTVGYQAVRTSLANPVEALRCE